VYLNTYSQSSKRLQILASIPNAQTIIFHHDKPHSMSNIRPLSTPLPYQNKFSSLRSSFITIDNLTPATINSKLDITDKSPNYQTQISKIPLSPSPMADINNNDDDENQDPNQLETPTNLLKTSEDK